MTGVKDTNLLSVRKRSFDAQDLLCGAEKTNFQGRKNILIDSLTESVNNMPLNRKIFILSLCHSGKIQNYNY